VSRTLVDQKTQLSSFLTSTTTFTDTSNQFFTANADRLITLASASLPSLQTYARYSPEFPCIARGLTAFEPRVERSFGGLQPGLHITLEATHDNGAYTPGQEPRFLDDRGPQCYGLPSPQVPAPDVNYRDGYKDGQPSTMAAATPAAIALNPAAYLAGPQAQRQLLNAVVAPVMGVPLDGVPDIAVMLFGPMARGTTVQLS
jgi:hypothetical protein